MIDKENEDSSENYESEEDNQILITQEILSKESSQDEEESNDQTDCDGISACSYKSINMISKNSKTLNILIHNYVPLINSIYFQFWYIKDKLIRDLIHASKCVLNFEFSLQMEQETIKFGKLTLPMFPKINLSFRIHKDIEGLDISQQCILDNLWNAKSDIQKLEALNALSFHFKQLNDNLDSFSKPSSFDMHCIPMDTNLESSIARKM